LSAMTVQAVRRVTSRRDASVHNATAHPTSTAPAATSAAAGTPSSPSNTPAPVAMATPATPDTPASSFSANRSSSISRPLSGRTGEEPGHLAQSTVRCENGEVHTGYHSRTAVRGREFPVPAGPVVVRVDRSGEPEAVTREPLVHAGHQGVERFVPVGDEQRVEVPTAGRPGGRDGVAPPRGVGLVPHREVPVDDGIDRYGLGHRSRPLVASVKRCASTIPVHRR